MIIISHRGNLFGRDPLKENNPSWISSLLDQGIQVEVDLWVGLGSQGKMSLGHDAPEYEVDSSFISRNGLWVHAKNIRTLDVLLELGVNCFYHTDEDVVLTSYGYMWTQPGQELTQKSICVMPEVSGQSPEGAAGVCTDHYYYYGRYA